MGDIALEVVSAVDRRRYAPSLPPRRFNAWFVTHEVAWELGMAALAVV